MYYTSKILLKLSVVLSLLLFISCCKNSKRDNIFNFDKVSNIQFQMLNEKKEKIILINDYKEWIKKIASLFINNGKFDELLIYLNDTAKIENNKNIKSYLYFYISDLYWNNGFKIESIYYMVKIEKKYYFINHNKKPIGYYIANRIISSDSPFELKEKMYNILLSDFKEIIDEGYTLYEMSNFYKDNFRIEKAMKIMKKIVKESNNNTYLYDGINISKIKNEIDFYNSEKEWIYQDLEILIERIKEAVKEKDINKLKSYVSKREFIVKVFHKSKKDIWQFDNLYIQKRWNDRIVFSDKLEDYSSDKEAYLQTKNWNFPQLRIWYFYFKRVEYPYDADINGGWEWAGIFFGHPY